MSAQQLRQADQALLDRALRAESRARELEQALVLATARRRTRQGTGWVRKSRQRYLCHRCKERISIGSTYYRTLHNSKRQAKRVCYCQGCAMMLGHGAPVRKESIPDA